MPENTTPATTRIVPTTCADNCGGNCLLRVHVQDGVIRRIETDDGPEPQLRACARGRAYRQRVYSPDRLKYPMRRSGPRGEGRFERISWEEALDTVATELRRVLDTYGPEAILGVAQSGSMTSLYGSATTRRFLNLLGGQTVLAGDRSGGAAEAAGYYTYGEPFYTGNSREDLLNSRLILLWGWDPAVNISGTNTSWVLTQAREAGIRILCLDPRYTDSAAAWADQWIPLYPGTDVALMAAMAYVILTEGRQDQRFLDTYTRGFDRFREYILGQSDGMPKTPGWAQEITGVPAETTVALAREYATTRPAALMTGLGPQKTACGEQFMRAGMTLAAMTGNIGIPGGSAAGYCVTRPPAIGGLAAPPNPTGRYVPHMKWPAAILEGRAGGYPSDLKLAYITHSGLMVTQQNTGKGAQALCTLEFVVVHEQFMTPTARFADILLPVTTCFERNDLRRPSFEGSSLFFLNQAIEPLYQARSDLEIFTDLAHRLGFAEQYAPKTEEEWLKEFVEHSRVPDLDRFQEEGIARRVRPEPVVAFREQIADPLRHPFPTPSGKIEIYSERLAALGQPDAPPIPQYVEAWEGRSDPLAQRYPLQLLAPVSKKRVHSSFDNTPWLRELEPHQVWINPLDAQERGIQPGDWVKVFNDRGVIRIQAKVTERIMPGVVCVEGGTWYDPDPDGVDRAGCANVLTKDEVTPMPLLPEGPLPVPSIGSGSTYHNSLVEVEKNDNDRRFG
ncbi:MAG: molybdopterin-dependent oxidoreductase [Candidatus Tectomicrobia bacterium]|uniref:Molybdopterin-dependent oxidoreductase n=1 Tax=Tectimicrobiota bacterium TaxID=2528274 RepID=A0A932FXW3_UNCTE|nr:molybdopterin-dependent oxidoreductase [Candidatus Tectomicrobia bacterium]